MNIEWILPEVGRGIFANYDLRDEKRLQIQLDKKLPDYCGESVKPSSEQIESFDHSLGFPFKSK